MKQRKKTEEIVYEIDASSGKEAKECEDLEKIDSSEVHVLFNDLDRKLKRDHKSTV